MYFIHLSKIYTPLQQYETLLGRVDVVADVRSPPRVPREGAPPPPARARHRQRKQPATKERTCGAWEARANGAVAHDLIGRWSPRGVAHFFRGPAAVTHPFQVSSIDEACHGGFRQQAPWEFRLPVGPPSHLGARLCTLYAFPPTGGASTHSPMCARVSGGIKEW